jgi:hypothetical protein
MSWRTLITFAIIAVLGVGVLPATSSARCKGRCRQAARACKTRCRLAHPHFGPRRRCVKACQLRELDCKMTCR